MLSIKLQTIDDFTHQMFITFVIGVSIHCQSLSSGAPISLVRRCFLASSSFILLLIDCFSAFCFISFHCFNFPLSKILGIYSTEQSMPFVEK